MTTASVELWGRRIGAVTWDSDHNIGIFQYTPEFGDSGIEVAPLRMPWREAPYEFQTLSPKTFKGLWGTSFPEHGICYINYSKMILLETYRLILLTSS